MPSSAARTKSARVSSRSIRLHMHALPGGIYGFQARVAQRASAVKLRYAFWPSLEATHDFTLIDDSADIYIPYDRLPKKLQVKMLPQTPCHLSKPHAHRRLLRTHLCEPEEHAQPVENTEPFQRPTTQHHLDLEGKKYTADFISRHHGVLISAHRHHSETSLKPPIGGRICLFSRAIRPPCSLMSIYFEHDLGITYQSFRLTSI